jgi:TRAP-type C4-dicarboxylate transport system permease small subunit
MITLFLNMVERLALVASRFTSSIAAVVLFWIVAVTCVNVIGRYFFNTPLYAGEELVKVSMAGVIFLSLPAMFFKNEHIIVDLFPIFQKGYLGWILSMIFLAISAYCLWIIADKTMFYANRSLEDGDVYEYILMPAFLSDGKSQFAPKFIIETFMGISLYFTSFLICLRLALVASKPGSSAEFSEKDQ